MRVHSVETVNCSDFFENYRRVLLKPGQESAEDKRVFLMEDGSFWGHWIVMPRIPQEKASENLSVMDSYIRANGSSDSYIFSKQGAILVKAARERKTTHAINPETTVREVSIYHLLGNILQNVLEIRTQIT
jgi:hypothetical protein